MHQATLKISSWQLLLRNFRGKASARETSSFAVDTLSKRMGLS
jgi:hypothetical protein